MARAPSMMYGRASVFFVHRSNRPEKLLDRLAALVAAPPDGPFERETIVVQGKGMERWLSMELARRIGVWANPSFPFPRTLLNRALEHVVGGADASAAFEPEVLKWMIARLLRDLRGRRELTPIDAYLAHDDSGVRRLRLAAEVAVVFDRYVLYRPDLLAAWEANRDEGDGDWQPVLWRAIVAEAGANHLAARVRALITTLGKWGQTPFSENGVRPHFPRRVSIFGVTTLAPLYLHAFAALGRVLDVHLFLLAPSREFMGDSRRRGTVQLELAFASDAPSARNPLLASLGKLSRDFQELLEDVEYAEDEEDLFVDPAPRAKRATALHVVQSDMLNVVERREGGDAPPLRLAPDDFTIEIHSCHSPMREVEVVHDRLLALFDEVTGLEPRDVVVMAPSIDEYAPYVDAVFSADQSRVRVPYHLADRAPRLEEPVAAAFLRILEVLRGRVTAPELYDLLAMDVVRGRFAIDTSELERIRGWIAGAGIRWGVDERHRAAAGQPSIRENTWAFGFDRLFLGFAASRDDGELFENVLPFEGVEGTDAEVLGRFAELCQTLFGYRDLAERPRTVPAWEEALGALLGALVQTTTDNADQHRRIRRALHELTRRAGAARFEEEIPLDAYRRELEKEILEGAAPWGFLSGGVTFCAMVPMRSIPFRVVCLLGMNDRAFPRAVYPPAFDRTAREPRPGDRTRRDDDRALFLEALLAARDRFLVTTVGQSIQDNSTIPPSVVVSDLLDTIVDSFRPAADDGNPGARRKTLLTRFVVRHPLQSFSAAYFTGDRRLFSYSKVALEAARAERAPRRELPPFLERSLDPPAEDALAVSLEELERFLEHPARWFCQRRLGLYLGRDLELLDEREPLELDALGCWQIGEPLLSRLVDGVSIDEALAAVRASGVLPPGALGRQAYEAIAAEAWRIALAARPFLEGGRRPPIELDVTMGGVRVTGVLRDVYPKGQVDCRYSKLRGRHELRFWLRHLFLNLRDGVPHETFLFARPADDGAELQARFRPVENPKSILSVLVDLYRAALRFPPALFPESSRLYVCEIRRGGDEADVRAMRAVRKLFIKKKNAGDDAWGDGADEYVVRLFGRRDEPPSDDGPARDFRALARNVFDPLLDHRDPEGL